MNIELLPLKITAYNLKLLQSFVNGSGLFKNKKTKKIKKTIFYSDNLCPMCIFICWHFYPRADKWYYAIRTSSCFDYERDFHSGNSCNIKMVSHKTKFLLK